MNRVMLIEAYICHLSKLKISDVGVGVGGPFQSLSGALMARLGRSFLRSRSGLFVLLGAEDRKSLPSTFSTISQTFNSFSILIFPRTPSKARSKFLKKYLQRDERFIKSIPEQSSVPCLPVEFFGTKTYQTGI